MELYVISERRLQTINEWQDAIDKFGFPIRFEAGIDFESTSGFLPLRLHNRLSGFECDHWTIDDIKEIYGYHRINPNSKYVLAFRWSGDYDELISVTQASAAYAIATDGLLFDCQEGDFISNEKAIEMANTIEEQVKSWR